LIGFIDIKDIYLSKMETKDMDFAWTRLKITNGS
jgi:hypothetical protein